jgi:hypothetical protein
MVRVRVVMVLCSWPDCQNEAEEWFMTPPGKPRCGIDLCDKHSVHLWAAYQYASKGGDGPQVKTMQQIDREKGAATAAATRRARKKS